MKPSKKQYIAYFLIVVVLLGAFFLYRSSQDMYNNISHSDYKETDLGHCSLDVEMETGTGKTFVYTKTMFELNKVYGWTKFIIVVPSIAIREGVYASIQDTVDYFQEEYKKKARCFIYSSSNLTQLDSFSRSLTIFPRLLTKK